jgi:uncharacterized protein YukE
MADRVLVTAAAEAATRKMESIINGPLLEQINALNREAQTLSDPNVWDGRSATKFRSRWPEIHSKLKAMQEAVEELRRFAKDVHQDVRIVDNR